MANLNKKALGSVKGALGDLVFKERYGRTYVATKPKTYTIPQDEKSQKIRGKFRFCIKLFAAMGKVNWFKVIWCNSNVPGDIYSNKMFKVNASKIGADFELDNISLLPIEEAFTAVVTDTSIESSQMEITIDPPDKNSGAELYNKLSMQGIIYLREGKEPYKFLPVISDDVEYIKVNTVTFKIKFSEIDQGILSQYKKKNYLLNIFTKDSQGHPHKVSRSIHISL